MTKVNIINIKIIIILLTKPLVSITYPIFGEFDKDRLLFSIQSTKLQTILLEIIVSEENNEPTFKNIADEGEKLPESFLRFIIAHRERTEQKSNFINWYEFSEMEKVIQIMVLELLLCMRIWILLHILKVKNLEVF